MNLARGYEELYGTAVVFEIDTGIYHLDPGPT